MEAKLEEEPSIANSMAPAVTGTGDIVLGLPSPRQSLFSVCNSGSRATSCLMNAGLAGKGIILRYNESYFLFYHHRYYCCKEDKSRVLILWELDP